MVHLQCSVGGEVLLLICVGLSAFLKKIFKTVSWVLQVGDILVFQTSVKFFLQRYVYTCNSAV